MLILLTAVLSAWRDGVKNITYDGVNGFDHGRSPEVPHLELSGYNGAPWGRLVVEGGTCKDKENILLSYQAGTVDICAQLCFNMLSCTYFEYNTANHTCHYVVMTTYPKRCVSYEFNETNTYAMVLPGTPVVYNTESIAFLCECHFTESKIYSSYEYNAFPQVTAEASGDWGLTDYFSIQLSTRDTTTTTVTSAESRYATLVSRKPHVSALVLSDGSIQFEASRLLGDACLCPAGTISWASPYDFSFSRVGSLLTIKVNGKATVCTHILHHLFKLTPLFSSMSFASIPSAWRAIENQYVRCKDSYTLLVSQGEDQTRDDCGARCSITPSCSYFLWEEARDRRYVSNANSHVATCTLYSSCALLNATLMADGTLTENATYNGTGTLYAMQPRYQGNVMGWAVMSVQTTDAVCLRTVSQSNIPAVGDKLFGSVCHEGASSLPLTSQMFKYDNGTLRVFLSDDLCVSHDAANSLVLVPCSNRAYFVKFSDSTYRLASDPTLCIEIALHAYATLKPCSGNYQNQTLILTTHAAHTTTYHFTDTSGLNNWIVTGGTATHSYEATARGIAPYPLNDVSSHDPITVRSPVFCSPTSVSFTVSGGRGLTSSIMPYESGYLGIVLRDIATNQITKYHTQDHFYFSTQSVTWTDTVIPSDHCYSLELYDDATSYLVLQDVVVTSKGTPYCNEISAVRVRNPRGGATLHLKEVKLFTPAGENIASAGSTVVTASSSLYHDTLRYVNDGDATSEVNYHENLNATVAEWVMLAFDKTVLSEVVIVASIHGRTCMNEAECLRESSSLLVELLSEGKVVQQYTSLDASDGNVTQEVCGFGRHNGSFVATSPEKCVDGLYDTNHPCSITSTDQTTTSPYFKLDLGATQAVARVTFYVKVENTTDPLYEVWIGANGDGPYAADPSNTQCFPAAYTIGNTTYAVEYQANISSATSFEVSCQHMGRYVYVVYPEAFSFEVYEVQAYAEPSALVPVESPALEVSAFSSLPVLRRTDSLQDWSQAACTIVPVKSISVNVESCNVDTRVALSTVPNPSNETQYHHRNSTALPPEFSFIVSLSTKYGTLLVDNVDEEVTLGGRTCSGVGIPWVLSRDGDAITVSHDGTNITLSRKYSGELYGCVLPYEEQAVWYATETCSDNDLLTCGGTSKYITPISIGGDSELNRTEGSMTATIQDVNIETKYGVESRLSLSQTLNRHAGGNVTSWNTCFNDYVFTFARDDAAYSATKVLLEFNTTLTVWVKIYVQSEVVPGWLTLHGWSAVPRSSMRKYSLAIDDRLTTRAIYVKKFEANELVEVSGLGTATTDVLASPYIVCVSTSLDVELDSGRYLTMYESFDGALGKCSRPSLRNVADAYRSASSVVHGTPGKGLHRGRLDSLRAWKAQNGGILGDWYQIDIEGTVSLVQAIVTQGHEEQYLAHSEWVTLYTLNYSVDGVVWDVVDAGRTWDANYDYKTHVTHTFAAPLWARYIRIIPLKWYRAMALRAAVITCDADVTTHTGLFLNTTGSCIAEQDSSNKVEGNASLLLRSGYASYACEEAVVSKIITTTITPTEIVIWGRVSDARRSGAWVFTLEATAYSGASYVEFSTGSGGSFFAGTPLHSAGGVESNVWFCLTIRFVQKNGRVIALKWALTGTAPAGTKVQRGQARGLIVVDWQQAITGLKMSKKVPEADSWFDALQVFTDSTTPGALSYSFDSEDDIDPSSKCDRYVGYNVTRTGDFSLHRLTALDLPYLSHRHCVEHCCSLHWCTGVALKYSNDTLFNNRGCRLMRQAFFSTEPDHYQELYFNNWQWQFLLKYAVVSLASTSSPVLEVNEHEMRALDLSPSLVLNYTLHFRGALLDLTASVVRDAFTSSVSSSQELRGFTSLKDTVLPLSAVDVTSYPPYVTVSLYSAANYHITGDEVLSWSYFNEALKGANVTLSKGGGVVGAVDLPVVKLRGSGRCDGSTACNKRPCVCSSLECQRAYICGCRSPSMPIPQVAFTSFTEGSVVYLVNDAQYVRYQQKQHAAWDPSMLDYIGTQGTVTSVPSSETLVVRFPSTASFTFHTSTVLKTSGVEICIFHRRPTDWPFDYPAPPTYT